MKKLCLLFFTSIAFFLEAYAAVPFHLPKLIGTTNPRQYSVCDYQFAEIGNVGGTRKVIEFPWFAFIELAPGVEIEATGLEFPVAANYSSADVASLLSISPAITAGRRFYLINNQQGFRLYYPEAITNGEGVLAVYPYLDFTHPTRDGAAYVFENEIATNSDLKGEYASMVTQGLATHTLVTGVYPLDFQPLGGLRECPFDEVEVRWVRNEITCPYDYNGQETTNIHWYVDGEDFTALGMQTGNTVGNGEQGTTLKGLSQGIHTIEWVDQNGCIPDISQPGGLINHYERYRFTISVGDESNQYEIPLSNIEVLKEAWLARLAEPDPTMQYQWCIRYPNKWDVVVKEGTEYAYNPGFEGTLVVKARPKNSTDCYGKATALSIAETGPHYRRVITPKAKGAKTKADIFKEDYGKATEYFDDHFRPIQQVVRAATPMGKDVVKHIDYDANGRQYKTYYGYPSSENTGAYKPNAKTETENYYAPAAAKTYATTQRPFAEREIENSPLATVVSTTPPGENFTNAKTYTRQGVVPAHQASDYYLNKYAYGENGNQATIDIQKYSAEDVERFAWDETEDADGHLLRSYTDQRGLLVRKEFCKILTRDGAGNPLTYSAKTVTEYVYNDLGTLVLEIPAKAADLLQNQAQINIGTDGIPRLGSSRLDLVTYYQYDDAGRLTMKYAPSQGRSWYVYDKWDRQILWQNEKMKAEGQWHFTKYDAYHRTVLTGLYAAATSRASLQGQLDGWATSNNGTPTMYEAFTGTTAENRFGYTSNAFPTGNFAVHQVQYYEVYDLDRDESNDYAFGSGATQAEAQDFDEETHAPVYTQINGLPTVSKSLLLDGETTEANQQWVTSVVFYSEDLKPIQTQYHEGGLEAATVVRSKISDTHFGYTGVPLCSREWWQTNGPNGEVARMLRFEHDANDRLTRIKQKINDGSYREIATYTYNEMGQLTRKKLAAGLQLVDYAYHLHGQLKRINDMKQPDGSKRYFSEELFYEEADPSRPQGSPVSYSGKITSVCWNSRKAYFVHYPDKTYGVNQNQWPDLPTKKRAYDYFYDAEGRLEKADYLHQVVKPNQTALEIVWKKNDADENFAVEQVLYDRNGNLTHLKQHGPVGTTGGQPVYQVMDQLTYTYGAQSNQLMHVTEDAPALPAGTDAPHPVKDFVDGNTTTADNYDYDENGNLLLDRSKKISAIHYHAWLNLPSEIQYEDGKKIVLTYTAGGTLMRRDAVDETNNPKKNVEYFAGWIFETLAGAEGYDMQYIGHPEGRLFRKKRYDASQAIENYNWTWEYHLTDHLGNMRVSFYQSSTDAEYTGDPNDPDKSMVQSWGEKATMELVNQNTEEAQFERLPETRNLDAVRARTGSYLARIDAKTGRPFGPTKVFAVQQGDSIAVHNYAYYEPAAGHASFWSTLIPSLLSAGLGSYIAAGGETGLALQAQPLLGLALLSTPALLYGSGGGAPKAYYRYVRFNADSQVVFEKVLPITEDAEAAWQELLVQDVATEDGYVVTYTYSQGGDRVYTDDLDVRVYAPVACQENHYYPFGLNMATIEYMGEPGTSYQYNGKEKEDVFDLCWYDYGARWYDPQLGRWFNVDPAEQVASPYDFCGGDPVANVDPDGRSFSRWSAQNESSIVLANIAVAGVVVTICTAGIGGAPSILVYAAATGALMGGISAAYAGGDVGQIIGCAAIGAAVSVATAGMASGLPASFTSTLAGSIITGAAVGAVSGATQGGLNALVMGYNVDQAITQGLIGGALGGAAGGALGWGIKKLMDMGTTKAGNTAKGETNTNVASPEKFEELTEGAVASLHGGGGPTGAKAPGKNLQNGPVPKQIKGLKGAVKPATAPAATAHAGTAAAVLAGAQAVYHLLNALSSATSLTVSPAVFFLPLMMLTGDTPNRGGAIVLSKGGKQNIWDDEVSGLSSEEWAQWKANHKDQKAKIQREDKRRGLKNKQKRNSRGY